MSFRNRRALKALRTCTHLMVVAHPDDETLWGGVQLAEGNNWGVICSTNGKNRARANAFVKAMKILGCCGIMLDVADRREHPPTNDDLEELAAFIGPLINGPGVVQVVTHGPDGEYGHPMHIAISELVTRLMRNVDSLYYFNFSETQDARVLKPRAWNLKESAIVRYLGPPSEMVDSDRRHYLLSMHEAPVQVADYVRPKALLRAIYAGSEVTIT